MKHLWKKIVAVTLTLALCLAPAAQALTADQLKDLLEEYYIDEVPQEALDAETVEEVIEALGDPYTMYMTPEELEAFQASMKDSSVVGIGISALADEGGLLVVGVYEGSPAEKLGLVAGDLIIEVDGNQAAGQPAEIISGWLKGEEGTQVAFTVRHADGSEKAYTATRAQVTIPATTTELLEDGTTGYIACTTFGEDTLGHFTEGIQAYDDVNLWLVDLRNNGGGDVYAVTQTLGTFLGEGTTVYLRDGEDQYYRYVSEQESLTISPAIVLVSPQTASAAEIFSLAMKDKQGGMVIGSNTYGKGVAQIVLTEEQQPEALDDDALRITAYQYYGVNGNTANSIGVVPDLLVKAEDADEIAQLFSSREPSGDKSGWLRIHLGGWRWYVDLDHACSAKNAVYFGEMLSALAPGCVIMQGIGDTWIKTTAQQVAELNGVPNYEPRTFSDVEGQDCERAANTLRTYEMLLGYKDGTFRPDNTLTRAELCALLVQAMGLSASGEGETFTDVAENSWYAPYIKAACTAGYMKGVGDGCFNPQGKVTHEEMITVLGRLAAKLNLTFYQASKQTPENTGAPDAYSDWAEPWAWLLAKSQKNILGQPLSMLYDDLENIEPQTPATRGETAQVLYTILTAVEVIKY